MTATAMAEPKKWAREYETIYILRPNVDTEDADKVAERFAEIVSRLGGKITKVDVWGKRKLAYLIKKHSRGIFVYVQYVGYNDLVAEIERNLRLLDSVIRYQTIVTADMVDLEAVEVDAGEIEFTKIEKTEDEEEPGFAERLGLRPPEPERAEASESEGDESEGDESEGDESEGDESEGDESEGDESEGDESEGDESEGDESEGDDEEPKAKAEAKSDSEEE